MEQNQRDSVFNKFYNRLRTEGVLRSLVCALICGFGAMAVCAVVCWLVGFGGWWIDLIVFAVAVGASMPALYFLRYRPTTKAIAARVDGLGLDERILTMFALEHDESYIAMKQREDALAALSTVSATDIKYAITAALLGSAIVLAVLGLVFQTVHILASADVIPFGTELIEEAQAANRKEYKVTYVYDGEGGQIFGELEQMVKEGESALPVIAVEKNGFVFVGWSDGYAVNYRHDENVKNNLILKAVFEEIEQPELEGEDEESEDPEDKGPKPDQQQSNSNDPEKNPEQFGNVGAYAPGNQIIDGETYYGTEYENAYAEALERIMQDDSIPQYIKDYINDYFESIKK